LFDASALCKRYSDEPGSERLGEVAARTSELLVAAHCKAEIASALNQQRQDEVLDAADYAALLAEVQQDFAEFTVVPLDSRVEALAIAAMERSRVRALDALHLASALVAKVDVFVTADRRQARAAEAAGLKTELVEA
jgi:predicted nucleic acid-binding protein